MSLAAYIRRERPKRPPAKGIPVPAPMGSVNTISGGEMPAGDCIYRYNMIASEYGLRTRLGSREWCTTLDGEVRALLPFTGSTSAGNKLFATTATGIWDVTSSSAAPTQVVTFPTSDTTSGYAVSAGVATAAGHFLLVTDQSNGLYVWSESGAAWSKVAQGAGPTQINGVDPSNLVSVLVWKHRVWLTERDSGRAWYLGTNAIYGSATSYNFGAQFAAGGPLVGLWSWTGDGGAGIDDHLVAVSGAGDILVYKGTDPATAGAFGLNGRWNVGAVPMGRQIASKNGGDLLIMTSNGIFPVSTLDRGAEMSQASQYETAKIANLFSDLQAETANQYGWSMAIHPQDGTLIVTVPTNTDVPKWLAMSLWNKGWSVYRDLPASKCAVAWDGKLYFGTDDGRVMINDGYVDGVTLADPDSYAAIGWSLLTGFSDLGTTNQKRVNLIRATFLRGGDVTYDVQARYSWDLDEIAAPSASAVESTTARWDSATWDVSVWASDYTADQQIRGAVGMGPEVAIAIRGTATTRTILQGFHVFADEGGML